MRANDRRRAKSGKEVRDFLRGLGISLDSGAAVIKQVGAAWLAALHTLACELNCGMQQRQQPALLCRESPDTLTY